ncbi:MAG TPA: YciI family protein [Bacteroidota bacterium]|nr:YciI family protein [Bacteroidota bacterium]
MHRRIVFRSPALMPGTMALLMVIVGASVTALHAQNPPQPAPAVDTVLAKRLGADGRGMRPYVLALLKSGPNRSQDSATAASLLKAHLANIQRMADEGKLVLAGPFLDDTGLQGIYIFNVRTVEEAKALTESDPAIKAGRLVMELHPWYGSAALQMLNEIHKRIRSKPL